VEPTFDLAARILAAQPFSRHLGARLTAFGDRTATLEIDLADHHRQQDGYVHGGVLAYAADNVITFAAGTALGPHVLTAGLTIDYLAPAVGRTLRAQARVIRANTCRAICRAEIHAVDDTDSPGLVAVAQGTVVSR
jgi:uncharacterized protein (TIGR00369 family)